MISGWSFGGQKATKNRQIREDDLRQARPSRLRPPGQKTTFWVRDYANQIHPEEVIKSLNLVIPSQGLQFRNGQVHLQRQILRPAAGRRRVQGLLERILRYRERSQDPQQEADRVCPQKVIFTFCDQIWGVLKGFSDHPFQVEGDRKNLDDSGLVSVLHVLAFGD